MVKILRCRRQEVLARPGYYSCIVTGCLRFEESSTLIITTQVFLVMTELVFCTSLASGSHRSHLVKKLFLSNMFLSSLYSAPATVYQLKYLCAKSSRIVLQYAVTFGPFNTHRPHVRYYEKL